MPITYTLIQATTLGSNTNTVTFSSIPQTYTDLIIKTSVRSSTSAADNNIRFNGDSSSLYFTKGFYTDFVTRSGYTSGALSAGDLIGMNAITSLAANTFNISELYIGNYSSTTLPKQTYYSTRSDNTTTESYYHGSYAILYNSTNAISSVTITTAFQFVTNSSFYLYGVKRN